MLCIRNMSTLFFVFFQKTTVKKDNDFQKESVYSNLACAESFIATWCCGVLVSTHTTRMCIFYPRAHVKTKQMGKDPTMCGLGLDDDKLTWLRRLNAQRHIYLTRCVLSHNSSGSRILSNKIRSLFFFSSQRKKKKKMPLAATDKRWLIRRLFVS